MSAFWLDEEQSNCVRQIVVGKWTMSPYASLNDEIEEINRHALLNNGKILLEGEHAVHWEARMQNGASITIRCTNKPKPLIAVVAMNTCSTKSTGRACCHVPSGWLLPKYQEGPRPLSPEATSLLPPQRRHRQQSQWWGQLRRQRPHQGALPPPQYYLLRHRPLRH